MAVKLGDRLAARTLMVGGGLLTAIGFAWFGLISVADGYGLGLTVSGALLVAAVLVAVAVLRRPAAEPLESGTVR